jgi:ABC-type dipeptide/oligopeptide/nickel transport system ATPase subunit
MRLKKLILHGFKSFADRTEFVFDSPITGIVGPNGCGKSNVVDGFKWVLGEQSAKSLRGDAMMDVIFNGSAARKPSGMSEVILVFENPRRADDTRIQSLMKDKNARIVPVWRENHLLVHASDTGPRPRYLSFEEVGTYLTPAAVPPVFLGIHEDKPWFALGLPASDTAPHFGEGKFEGLRENVAQLPITDAALLAYAHHAAVRETIRLRPGHLLVQHVHGGRLDEVEFAPSWVRIEPRTGDRSLIELSGQGRRIAVGRYVRPELRRQLADELRWALRRWQVRATTEDESRIDDLNP